MKIETLEDVIEWCRQLHRSLSECLQQGADEAETERNRMLLDYLAEHESGLARLMERFEATAEKQALDTWCYEYFERQASHIKVLGEKPLREMSTTDIITALMEYHEQVIELYRYLLSLENSASSAELLNQLIALEEHEAMRMVQSANRLEDL